MRSWRATTCAFLLVALGGLAACSAPKKREPVLTPSDVPGSRAGDDGRTDLTDNASQPFLTSMHRTGAEALPRYSRLTYGPRHRSSEIEDIAVKLPSRTAAINFATNTSQPLLRYFGEELRAIAVPRGIGDFAWADIEPSGDVGIAWSRRSYVNALVIYRPYSSTSAASAKLFQAKVLNAKQG